ncbi:LacI family transcriptional regulator [Anaerotruncus sp. AF02-27]|nr:LacI family transcriptional regulator [Anaerotruncus sp. AF02-27]
MTIYDIAKLAGVSPSTVSRVLNNKQNLREETRLKVQKVLDENHYTPSMFAQSLVSSSMRTIGILVTDIRELHHSNTAYTIEQEFSRLGYCCMLCNTGEEPESQSNYLRMMGARKVDGVVLLGSVFQTRYIQNEIARHLPETPVVMANGYLPLPNVCGILCDDRGGVCECVTSLLRRGHTQIGFVQDFDNASSRQKCQGYLEAFERMGIACNRDNIHRGVCSIEGGMDSTRRLLERNPLITAILFGEDIAAVGGIKALKKLGKRVPQDVEVAGFNNSVYTEVSSPELTSVDNKMGIMGMTAARTLYDMISGVKPASRMTLSVDVVYRESLKK